MNRPTLAIAIWILCATVWAQHVHESTTGNTPSVINGRQHPELIPDSTAYRLVLLTVSEMPNPTEDQKARQRAFLAAIPLSDGDLQAIIPVLTDFKVEYTDLVKRYNKSVETANESGVTPDLATFLRERDLLVESTRYTLSSALSSGGMDRFHAHVQREKTKMIVPLKEAQ